MHLICAKSPRFVSQLCASMQQSDTPATHPCTGDVRVLIWQFHLSLIFILSLFTAGDHGHVPLYSQRLAHHNSSTAYALQCPMSNRW